MYCCQKYKVAQDHDLEARNFRQMSCAPVVWCGGEREREEREREREIERESAYVLLATHCVLYSM